MISSIVWIYPKAGTNTFVSSTPFSSKFLLQLSLVMPFLPRIRTSHLDIIYQLAVCVIFSPNVESVEIVEFAMLTVKSFVASRAFVMPFRSILHTGCGNSGYKVAVSIPRHRNNRAFRFVSTVDLQDFTQIH